MPDTISTAFVQEYKGTVDLLLQQMGTRFRDKVTIDSYTGKAASVVEQFGPAVAQKKTSRHSPTPLLDVPQDKRWVFPNDYEWASLIDKQDELRMIVDPTSPYAVNGANAMMRAQDDEIIGQFFATAKTGENGTTDESFDTTNYRVEEDVGGTASSMNTAKMQSALRKLMSAYEGEVMEPIYLAITSQEHDALLNEIQITSKDFNGGNPVLENGRVKRFLGMDLVLSERLTDDGTDRKCPCWTKTGMHLGIWNDIMPDIGPRRDLSNAMQVYLCMTIGSTRLQQGKVIEVQTAI